MADSNFLKNGALKNLEKFFEVWRNFLGTILLFNALFYVLRQFNQTSLVFDQLNMIGALCFFIILFFRSLTKKREKKIIESMLIVIVIVLSSQSILLNVDRSRSTFVLSWISLNKVEYKLNELDLSKVQSPESSNPDAINNRIEEQLSRGLIEMSDENKPYLTYRGKFILWTSELLSKAFHLNGWEKNAK